MFRLKISKLRQAFFTEVDALPLDIFRAGVGVMTFCYFIRLLIEAEDFSYTDGLLDHELGFKILWFTKLTLMGTWMSDPLISLLLWLGLLATIGLTIGWRSKPCAFYIFLLVVCLSRRNFLVLSVDDCSIYLLMFWLMLMPIGRTFCLIPFLKGQSDIMAWCSVRVPGAILRCFLINISLYYLTVGLSKMISPLWRDGVAVYAVLRMPIARTFGYWGEEHFAFLWTLNHLTIFVEAALAFLPLLRSWNRWKWVLLMLAIVTHVSIVVFIGVPYVNGTMLLAMILIFRTEIMDTFRKKLSIVADEQPLKVGKMECTTRIAFVFLILISMVGTKGIPVLGNLYKPGVGALYMCGIAQDYHLFDWIDRFNFMVENQVVVQQDGKKEQVSDAALFPPSLRGKILQSYIHHMRWMPVNQAFAGTLRRSILLRSAERFARRTKGSGSVVVKVFVQRIDHRNLSVDQPQERPLMKFRFQDGKAIMEEPY